MPLASWSEADVFAYIAAHGLTLPMQYGDGYPDSIEYLPCPAPMKAARLRYLHRDTVRPSDFTEALADRIFDRLGEGASLSEVCQNAANEAFRRQYAVACELRAEGMGDAILSIADTAAPEDTQRARLMVDTRKWLMAKLAPKKYGDKIANEISGPNGGPVEVNAITDMDRAKALAAMMARTLGQVPPTPAK